ALRSANTSSTGTTPITNQFIDGTYKLAMKLSLPSNSTLIRLKLFLFSS
ncbi:hypothetical protein D046_8515B, partial [Vibrio parahaemolyticus V-223/04]